MEPSVYLNSVAASAIVDEPPEAEDAVLEFHKRLPTYGETSLHSIPQLADELQLGHVLVKDESNRFGLPSFKILGASWAIIRAVTDGLDVNPKELTDTSDRTSTSIWAHLAAEVDARGLRLVTCTEGNWGRAVAHMAKHLSMPATIFVPYFMPDTTLARTKSEGPKTVVTRLNGNYDDAVAAARKEAESDEEAILVMDMGWEGYEKISDVSVSLIMSFDLC